MYWENTEQSFEKINYWNKLFKELRDIIVHARNTKDITDANSQWDDIKAVKIRNYKKDEAGDGSVQIGVVAQELEEAGMSGLVDEMEATDIDVENFPNINKGDKIKSVKYSVLYMKAIKALQEAMSKIETLETKVEALENA